jgi:hypothetical protein
VIVTAPLNRERRLAGGTVRAVGTAQDSGREGGFWAVIGGTEVEGEASTAAATIANGDAFAQQFEQLRGIPASYRKMNDHGSHTFH